MDLIKHKYLIYPILLLVLVWGTLRILSIDLLLSYYLPYSNIGNIAYDSRLDILNQLKNEIGSSKDTRYALIFGTSKSSSFDPNLIRKITKIQNLQTYNFCAPAASVGYHHFLWKQILSYAAKSGNYPKFILIESDTYQLEERSTQYALDYSLSISYLIEDSWDRISNFKKPNWGVEDIQYYVINKLFPIFKYNIRFSAILKNLKKVTLEDRRVVRIVNLKKEINQEFISHTKEKNGSYPNQFIVNTPSKELDQISKEMVTSHFLNFREKKNQLPLFGQLLEEFAVHKIPTIVYWPLFHPQLTEGLDKLPKIKKLKEKLILTGFETQIKHPEWDFLFSDPGQLGSFACDSFIDPFHLSGGCFPDLANFIFKDFSNIH